MMNIAFFEILHIVKIVAVIFVIFIVVKYSYSLRKEQNDLLREILKKMDDK